MRRDVLYEYDLPVELLDDLSDTEEVLEVFYARSEKRNLLPILFTRERIVWAYPETANNYRVYELQYIDLVSAYAKYVTPPYPTFRINTVDGQIYRFYHLVDAKEDMRGRLITLCGILKNKIGGNWRVWYKKSFLVDEFLLDRQIHGGAENIAGLPLCEPPSIHGLDDVFEEKPIPGKGCFESNEALFSHFPSDATEDVFEEFAPGTDTKPEDPYADKDAKIARIVEEVEADIQKARTAEEEKKVEKKHDDDAIIYGAPSGKSDEEQWGEVNDGGDAEILTDTQYLKRLEKINQQKTEYGPEDDDSVVYGQPKVVKKTVVHKEEESTVKMPPMYTKEDDDSIIYPTGNEEPVVITPMKKPKPEFEEVDCDEKASVSAIPKPVDIVADPTIPSMPLPAYEIGEDVKIAPRQKTPFEEANRDVITRMPVREINIESEVRPVFSNQDSLSPFLKASNLQPRPGFDSAAVDKLLEELKHLRDSGVISEEEYKERSLTLFRSD